MNKKILEIAEQLSMLSFKLVGILQDNEICAEQRRKEIHLMSPQRKKPKEGSISQRKDGRYEGRYCNAGRQKSIYASTYDACLKKLNAAVADKSNAPTIYSLYSWANEYLQVYKKPDVSADTYSAYVGYVKNYIQTAVRDMPLKNVKAIDLKKVLNTIETDRTREAVYGLLNGMFRQAYNEQIIPFNIMLGIARVEHSRNKGIALTVAQQSSFIQAIQRHKLRLYYLFCLSSGCRRAEALSVTAEDIDPVKNTLHIRGTKTDGSDRFIPLFDSIKRLLIMLPATGNLFNFKADYVARQFKKLVPTHKLHDLRHTFATRCLEAGVPLKVVQAWLGHSSIDTTANVYADVLDDFSQSEANKLKNMFDF